MAPYLISGKRLADSTPGQLWQDRLEQQQCILECRAVAVILEPREMGSWQHREHRLAIQRQLNEEKQGKLFHVIPVLLPRAKDASPEYLAQNMWIDFRDNGVSGLAERVENNRSLYR